MKVVRQGLRVGIWHEMGGGNEKKDKASSNEKQNMGAISGFQLVPILIQTEKKSHDVLVAAAKKKKKGQTVPVRREKLENSGG